MDSRITPIVQKAPYVAAGGTGFAAFTLNEWAVLVGIVATVLTTMINWYCSRAPKIDQIA
jgi:hypothetical protein